MYSKKQYEAFLKEFGLRIRQLRTDKGWTLEETELHGWPSWRHLQKIEAGKNITILTLRKIATLYKVNFSELLDDLQD